MKLLLLSLLAVLSFSCTPFPGRGDLASSVDPLFTEYSLPGAPGASLAIIRDGDVMYSKAYGLADVEKNIPATTATNYRLASVTKQFTATAILKLVDGGTLSLDSRITDVLPGMPAYAHEVRIRHLLTHTSGLVDYEDFVPDTQTVQVLDTDVLRILSGIDSVYFPAGTQFRYSNSGYALLALVVESVSGLSFAEFLKQNIFEPLGMHHTLAYQKGISTIDNRAFGHSKAEHGFVQTDQSNTSAVLGDGGVYSSVEDLCRWDRELYESRLISPRMRRASFTPFTLRDGTPTKYGFGWFIEPNGKRTSVYHTGSTRGFRNAIYRLPEERLTVIILTNRNDGEPIKIAEKVAEIVLGR